MNSIITLSQISIQKRKHYKGVNLMKLNSFKLQLAMANSCFSISDLAKKSKVSRVAIGNYLNGEGNAQPITIGKLARALDVPVTEIIEDIEK